MNKLWQRLCLLIQPERKRDKYWIYSAVKLQIFLQHHPRPPQCAWHGHQQGLFLTCSTASLLPDTFYALILVIIAPVDIHVVSDNDLVGQAQQLLLHHEGRDHVGQAQQQWFNWFSWRGSSWSFKVADEMFVYVYLRKEKGQLHNCTIAHGLVFFFIKIENNLSYVYSSSIRAHTHTLCVFKPFLPTNKKALPYFIFSSLSSEL